MITGELLVDEGTDRIAIKVCDNCSEHEGQVLMNAQDAKKGVEEIWYCYACSKAAEAEAPTVSEAPSEHNMF